MKITDIVEHIHLWWFKLTVRFKKRKNEGLPEDLIEDNVVLASIQEHNTYFQNLKNLKICLREREEHLVQLEESIRKERVFMKNIEHMWGDYLAKNWQEIYGLKGNNFHAQMNYPTS